MQPQVKTLLTHFISFAARELKLTKLPKINFVGKSEDSKRAFGHFFAGKNKTEISVRITDRHPIDIMRTIAHELSHWKQNQERIHSPETAKEDYANAMAGRIMRKYNTTHPSSFGAHALSRSSLKEEGTGAIPANAAGGDIGTTSPKYAGFSPLLLTRKKPSPKKLRQIVGTKK